MASQDRIVIRSPLVLSVLGVVSLAFLSALIGLACIDITKSKSISKLETPAILAAVFNVSSLFSVLVLVLLCLLARGSGWLQSVVLPLAGFMFAIAGACLSLSTFVIQRANREKLSSQVSFAAEMVVWVISAAVQIAFYVSIVFGRFTSDDRFTSDSHSSIMSFHGGKPPAPERPPTPPTPLRIVAPPYALPQARASPTFPLEPSSKRSSWRDSLTSIQNAVRPSASRQKLLGPPRLSMSRSSSNSGISDARSAATTLHSDAFDTWDTSNVDQQIKETVHLAVPTKGTALEPIPGSRPVSPAKALDGPFSISQQQFHSQERLGERPPTSLSVLSQLQRPPTAFSMASGHGAGTPTQRPSSPMLESHIHPLFRTDSPVPPPIATPGTVVTASPFSGHVIRATSRASSRIPLNDQAVSPVIGSRTGSMDDLPLRSSRSRSSSTARAMTPPIPDFILTANREKAL